MRLERDALNNTADNTTNRSTNEQPQSSSAGRVRGILTKFIVSIVLMGLFGYVLDKSGFFEGWRDIPQRLHWSYAGLFLLCMAVQHVFRVVRWKTVLEPFGVNDWRRIIFASSVGFAGVILLPLRSGEFIRPYLIRSNRNKGSHNAPFAMSKAFGGIFLERVVDLGLLSLTMMTTLLLRSRVNAVPGWLITLSILCVLGVSGLIVGTYVFAHTSLGHIVARYLERYTVGVKSRISQALLNLRSGIQPVFQLSVMCKLVFWSSAYWLTNALSLVCLGKFLGLTTVSLAAALCNVSTVGIGVMVPAGPAMAGSWEYFSQLSLGLYGNEPYTPFILLSHGLNIVWYALIAAIIYGLSLLSRSGRPHVKRVTV